MSNRLFAISGYNSDPNGYARASLPQGVQNPFVPAVIPYPSNLHGSQWSYVRSNGAFKPAVYNVLGNSPAPKGAELVAGVGGAVVGGAATWAISRRMKLSAGTALLLGVAAALGGGFGGVRAYQHIKGTP